MISLFFLGEAWKPGGAAHVCRVAFSLSPDLFTLCVCVYSTKHCSVSGDSVACKACFCGCPKALTTSSFDLSFKGHDRTLAVKGRILYLATLPLKGPENLWRVGSQASGYLVEIAHSPLSRSAASPAVTKVLCWRRAVLLGKGVPACSKWE